MSQHCPTASKKLQGEKCETEQPQLNGHEDNRDSATASDEHPENSTMKPSPIAPKRFTYAP